MDDAQIELRIEAMIRICRVVGWVLICGGALALASLVFVKFVAIDAQRETVGSKLASIGFMGLLPLIGVIFVFNPKERIASSLRRVMTMKRR